MSTAKAVPVAALLAALLLVGCGPQDPYTAERPTASPERGSFHPTAHPKPPPTAASQSGELPGRTPRELLDEPTEFPEAGRTPQATLELAAGLYGNWTSATAGRRLRRIAALSVGQAHAELRQAAAQAGVDRQQRDARSSATVETISVRGRGARRRALVVTRERVVAPDVPAEGWRYRVAVALLERRADGWLISRWAPQP